MIGPDWLPLDRAARQVRLDEHTLLLALIAGDLRGGDDGTVSWVDPDSLAMWAEKQRGRGEDQPNAHVAVAPPHRTAPRRKPVPDALDLRLDRAIAEL